jgi:hypothetical protein
METETHTEHGYRGGWAGPATVVVLIGAALVALGWLEVGLMKTLLGGG